jgi:hypothetical protein
MLTEKGNPTDLSTGGFIFVMGGNVPVSTIRCKRNGSAMKATERPLLYTPKSTIDGCWLWHACDEIMALICRMQKDCQFLTTTY